MYRIGGESKYTYTHSDTVSTKVSINTTVQYAYTTVNLSLPCATNTVSKGLLNHYFTCSHDGVLHKVTYTMLVYTQIILYTIILYYSKF